MNGTECENMAASLRWSDPANIISLAILLFIILLVISGNSLVIAAVFCSNKLRSVTNYLIVNLAVADLLVGLTVLPFSAIWEVFKIWIFGDVWCRMWLAVDVWMCTASILNLCAISLDRYVAVTRPVAYPSIMSTKRAKSLIAGVWVLSFVICFPPLVGWKDQKSIIQSVYTRENYTRFYTTTIVSVQRSVQLKQMQQLGFPYNRTHMSLDATPDILMSEGFNYQDPAQQSLESGEYIESSKFIYEKSFCSSKCELTNDRGYVLYSAFGSFYIPMFVMLFFYWRIYKAAVRTTRAIKQGFKTTKGSPRDASSSQANQTQMILRMHRGRPGGTPQRAPLSMHSVSSTLSVNSNGDDERSITHTPRRTTSMRIHRQRHEKISIKVSYPSSENVIDLRSEFVNSDPPYSTSLTGNTDSKLTFTHGRMSSFKTGGCEVAETSFKKVAYVANTSESLTGSRRDILAAIDGDISNVTNSPVKRRGGIKKLGFHLRLCSCEISRITLTLTGAVAEQCKNMCSALLRVLLCKKL
ncbi:PREDICTED: octopamine receptor Oamb isoform X3 [Bactrocera latifrons]|uniref:octopamine receptor Oamb isoform X3 n=1 Tax=Bactrocera latifrons TaxID=174628 RepID=UPI0008DE8572|nr:PREDICTED: octopamine receptor Oamb isoform X3 [Bactrocera latifrons]